jgi:hypothetical protein
MAGSSCSVENGEELPCFSLPHFPARTYSNHPTMTLTMTLQ